MKIEFNQYQDLRRLMPMLFLGKTTLTKYLSESLGMKLISTPPKLPEFQQARNFFDDQPESLRRAFYCLGNYLAAQDVIDVKQPVVMDR